MKQSQLATRPWRTGVGALILMLGACAQEPKIVQPNAPVAPPSTVGVAPPPVTQELPKDMTARHRVALLVPMTGTSASIGQAIANAANMAILDSGNASIRLTIYDTADGAASAAKKALAEGNQLILGPLFANDVRDVAVITRAANVPVISFSNDSAVAGEGVWLMGYSPNQSVQRLLNYAHAHGVNTIAAIAPKGLYGDRVTTALLRAAEDNGEKVVSVQSYDRQPASMASAAKNLGTSAAFDAVLIADAGKNAAVIAPFAHKINPNAHILGTELWAMDQNLGQTPALRNAWYASVSDALFNQLATRYRARFAKAPPRIASMGFDAVLLVNKIAAGWRANEPFPTKKLYDKGGFAGIDGVFRFGKDGVAERGLQVSQVTATGITVVSEAPNSLGN